MRLGRNRTCFTDQAEKAVIVQETQCLDLSQGLSPSLRGKHCSRDRLSHCLITSDTSSMMKITYHIDNINTSDGSGIHKAHISKDAKP